MTAELLRTRARRLQELQEKFLAWFAFVAPTVVRLTLGWAMWQDGAGKLSHLDGVTQFFSSMYLPFSNIPLPRPDVQAHFISALEYYGGFLLMIGLFTRPIGLLLAGAMVGAILLSDWHEFISKWVDATPTDATSFANFVLAVVLLCVGAGPFSVDGIVAVLYREWADDKPPLRTRLGEVVTCWVARGLVLLALVAIVPVAGAPAETMVNMGIRTRLVRPPRDGEFDSNPPAEVVEYPPALLHLALAGLLLVVLGTGVYLMFRANPETPPP